MIPLYDVQRLKRIPYITYGLIGVNMLVFLVEMLFSPSGLNALFRDYGAVPQMLTGNFLSVNSLTLLTSLFLHANWFHLASNLLVLMIFGDDIEDWLGRGLFLAFYLLCGVAGMLAQTLLSPNSSVPIIGASGAISGVLGAYAVVYAQMPIRCLTIRYFYTQRLEDIPAAWILIFWFVYQLFGLLLNLSGSDSNIAYFAHLGGFGAGYAFIRFFYVERFGKPIATYTMGYGNPFRAWGEVMRSRPERPNPRIIDFRQATNRSPQSNTRWQSNPKVSAKEMQDFEAELQSMREKVRRQPGTATPSKSQIEFVGLSALDQRARAMKFFTDKKGEKVEVETHNLGVYRGTVISLNSKQVMLRDDAGKNSWIPLEDIARVR